MVIFNSYFDITRGYICGTDWSWLIPDATGSMGPAFFQAVRPPLCLFWQILRAWVDAFFRGCRLASTSMLYETLYHPRQVCVFVCGFTDTTNQLVLLTNDPKKAEAPFTCVIHMYSHSMSCDALGPKYPNAHMGGFFEWGIPKLQWWLFQYWNGLFWLGWWLGHPYSRKPPYVHMEVSWNGGSPSHHPF